MTFRNIKEFKKDYRVSHVVVELKQTFIYGKMMLTERYHKYQTFL